MATHRQATMDDIAMLDYENHALIHRLETTHALQYRHTQTLLQLQVLEMRAQRLEKRNEDLAMELELKSRQLEESQLKLSASGIRILSLERLVEDLSHSSARSRNSNDEQTRQVSGAEKSASRKTEAENQMEHFRGMCVRLNSTVTEVFGATMKYSTLAVDTFARKVSQLFRFYKDTKSFYVSEFYFLCDNIVFLLQTMLISNKKLSKELKENVHVTMQAKSRIESLVELSRSEEEEKSAPTEMLMFKLLGLLESICEAYPEVFHGVRKSYRMQDKWEASVKLRLILPYMFSVLSLLYRSYRNMHEKNSLLEKLLSDQLSGGVFDCADADQWKSLENIHLEWETIRTRHAESSLRYKSSRELSLDGSHTAGLQSGSTRLGDTS